MTSEIRTNTLTSRAGLSTVTLTDSGPMFSGITTFVDNSTFSVGTGGTIHAPATNVMALGTNNIDAIKIDSSGNVNISGILTASSISGGVSLANGADNRVVTATGAAALTGESNLTFDGNNLAMSGTGVFTLTRNSRTLTLEGNYGNEGHPAIKTSSGHDLRIFTNGNNEKLRIKSTGELIVGTPNLINTSPSKFQVAANDATGSAIFARFNASVYSSYLDFYKSRSNTLGTAYVVNDDDHLGSLRFYGADGSNSGYTTAAEIYGSCDGGSGGSGDMPGRITFHTRPDGAGQAMKERLRINSNGQVGINTSVGGLLSVAVDSSSTNALATGFIALSLKNTNTTDNTSVCIDFNNSVGGIVGRIGAQFKDTSDKDTDLYFATRADGGSLAEALRIRSDSKVVVGTNAAGAKLSVSGNLITDDGTNARITLQADGTSTNQILSTTTGFGSYCDMSYQAAAHVFRYGGTETFRINADGTFRGKPDQVNGRDTNEVLGGKSFKYTTSNISPSWGSGSNGWYSFYHMSDGVYTFWLHTGAHSSICFTASNGYDPSLKSFITVHHFINNANGNYGNVKGIRVTTDGIVQVYLHASAANNYFEMYVQVTCGDLTNMPNLYATITKDTGSPTINDSWGTADAYSPAQGALTTDGVCSPRVLHNRREMSCFATSTGLYGANTSGAKGFYWDPDTASCQSAQPRNTGWSSYYINKHDGNGGSENRYIDFWHNNGQVGNITLSGSGVNYGSSSDYRLKKDDVVMTDGISRVKQLRPIRFKWIKDNVDDEGFFAHEAQAVVPIAVEGTKDQVVLQSEVDAGSQREDKSAGEPIYQTMDNSKLVPVLTASIKELITKVETLEQDNITLRARVTNLEGN